MRPRVLRAVERKPDDVSGALVHGKQIPTAKKMLGGGQAHPLISYGPLTPPAAITRPSVLMPNDENPYADSEIFVHNGIRENPQRKDSPSFRGWRTESGVFNQKLGDTFELREKATCNSGPHVSEVKGQCVGDVLFCLGVERVGHRVSRVRSRAMASCPGTAATEPVSKSASRRSASCSQAASTSGSESRLATSRSSKCDRSAPVSLRTSASRTSKFVLTRISKAVGARWPLVCHNTPDCRQECRGHSEIGSNVTI